ncbi:Rossmann-like and DUF2520 domain-containing protein [uncultured Alistipes sp.]|uniref:Rossmann-like and DUF2520 domain-containing protein n=1 Tax=uncultured Alistipes sp. TaxID=538949 RepID=UPI0032B2B38C
MTLKRIVLIGSGNLAEAIAPALKRAGLIQIFARNGARAEAIARRCGVAWSSCPDELAEADLYLIAVVDRAVTEVARSLTVPRGAVVAHTAGSVGLQALPAELPHRASFYPFQSFSRGREVDFSGIPIFLEASDPATLEAVREVASSISGRVYEADSERRRMIHLAGVFANNFSNAMYTLGERIAERAGLDFDVLRALITETALKASAAEHPRDVQTGPAVRGDANVQQAHLEMLAGDERMQQIYKLISNTIWETSKRTS